MFATTYESTHPLRPIPIATPGQRRPSLELSGFSNMFQRWDLTASPESSPISRRTSQSFDMDYPPIPPDYDLGAQPSRQRTTQACDKCRDRKTKCSGDHPVCKRCTARGLICHYSGRERVRGPAKARIRPAVSTSSLDMRYADDAGLVRGVKQEETMGHPLADYSPEYAIHHTYSPQQAMGGGHRRFPPYAPQPHEYTRMSLPQVPQPDPFYPFLDPHHGGHLQNQQQQQHFVRRAQSHSALRLGDAAFHHTQLRLYPAAMSHRPASQDGAGAARAPPAVVEFDMRQNVPRNTLGLDFDSHDDGASSGSEPPSATTSVFSINLSHSSESSESTLPEPLSRSASELDLHTPGQYATPISMRYRPQSQSLEYGKPGPIATRGFHPHSPAASIHSLSPPRTELAVPQIRGQFANPWAPDERAREAELAYPAPVKPITLSSEGVDLLAVVGGTPYPPPEHSSPSEGSVQDTPRRGSDPGAGSFPLLNTPLAENPI